MKIEIKFDIPVNIKSGNKLIKQINKKHIAAITENIWKNSRTNSDEEIISYEFGVIDLLDYEIIKDKIKSIDYLKVKFIVETNCQLSIKSAEEIIWAVFSATYTEDITYKFIFCMNSIFYKQNICIKYYWYTIKYFNKSNILIILFSTFHKSRKSNTIFYIFNTCYKFN